MTIKTKSLQLKKLDLSGNDEFAWAQRRFVGEIERQYNLGKPVRIIVLKARQLGISTAMEGVIYNWMFFQPGSNGLIIAHESEASRNLFEMTNRYWETWPFKSSYNTKYNTRSELSWRETGSHIKVATAKNLGSGRSSTLHAVHASECAFYADAATLMTGLNQTIPEEHGTIVTLESTANGMGNWFHKQWQSATSGDSDYVPLFFPWWKHAEYSIRTTLSIRSELDADELQLLRMGASFEHIAWRRWAIVNKANGVMEDFMQEYPATPDEAFISTGHPIFSHLKLRDCFKKENGVRGYLQDSQDAKPRFVADRAGNFRLFRRLKQGDTRQDRYFVSGDPSKSVSGDPSCIQVINRQTYEQVAVWHGRCDPVTFAYEMMRIGKLFNWATLCPEIEGGGISTIGILLNSNYPFVWMHSQPDRIQSTFNLYGWSTNYQRKQWAIGMLQRMILDRTVKLHDQVTYDQLVNYTELDNGEWGNADPEVHDDAVMALAIAVTASSREPFTPDAAPQQPDLVDIVNAGQPWVFNDGANV